MKNYDEMSDGEITIRVHYAFNGIPDGHATMCKSDYCNEVNDWFKIAEKFGMTLTVCGNAIIPRSISGFNHTVSHTCKGKIGRAVSICFLKMKDAENA